MESQESSIDATAALEHLDWVRRLARSLVRDASVADDITQETWLAALRRPAAAGVVSRSWLARVVRNAVRQENRRGAIRTEHEERARMRAEPESTDELVDRVHTQRMVVDAVLALDSSYQRVILLRYFEGLAPRDIARRLGISVETVKTRLRRALAQLREALDRRHGGDRSDWLPAVTVLGTPAGGGVGTSTLAIGAMAMGTMMKVSAAVLAAAACVYFVARTPRDEAPGSAVVEPPATEVELGRDELARSEPAVEGGRVETGRRSTVAERPSAGVAAVAGTNVLRVILEGITEESAGMATVTVAGVEVSNGRPVRIRSWPSRGSTSEFALDPCIAHLEERAGVLRDDELAVVVDHPLHFSETTRVALSGGAGPENGQNVYEVRVRLAEVVYWPELTLAVRDAHTGAHLEDVELRCVPTAYMGLVQQPGSDDPFTVIGDGLGSPIVMQGGRRSGEPEGWAAGVALRPAVGETPRPAELAKPEENERGIVVYARAPGHAWGRIVLDVSKGAERELLLEPAAALGVRFANVQLARYSAFGKEALLCITRIEPDGDEDGVLNRRLDETLAAEGVRIEALEPGELAVSVELGGALSMRKRPVLARERISLVAGETRELVLTLADSPAAPELAHLGGVVSFPAFGGEDRVRLQLFMADYMYGEPDFERALADMERVGGELPTWSFRLEDLPVGPYQVRLMPFEKDWMIELPAGGTDDVALVLPELAEVLVETVDARTGVRIPLEAIRYGSREDLPGRVRHEWSWTRTSTGFEEEPGRFRFWAAPGAAYVRTYWIPEGLNVGARRQDLELVPGPQTVRFELAPASTLRFEFRVDGAALPHEDGIFTGLSERVRAVGHEGRVDPMTYWILEASAPGLYEIDFEGLGDDRFQPLPPRRVEVREGETTEVIVELRRE